MLTITGKQNYRIIDSKFQQLSIYDNYQFLTIPDTIRELIVCNSRINTHKFADKQLDTLLLRNIKNNKIHIPKSVRELGVIHTNILTRESFAGCDNMRVLNLCGNHGCSDYIFPRDLRELYIEEESHTDYSGMENLDILYLNTIYTAGENIKFPKKVRRAEINVYDFQIDKVSFGAMQVDELILCGTYGVIPTSAKKISINTADIIDISACVNLELLIYCGPTPILPAHNIKKIICVAGDKQDKQILAGYF